MADRKTTVAFSDGLFKKRGNFYKNGQKEIFDFTNEGGCDARSEQELSWPRPNTFGQCPESFRFDSSGFRVAWCNLAVWARVRHGYRDWRPISGNLTLQELSEIRYTRMFSRWLDESSAVMREIGELWRKRELQALGEGEQ